MLIVDFFKALEEGLRRTRRTLGGDDDVLAIGGHLEGCVHPHVEQVHERLVDDESSAVAVLDELLGHGTNVYMRCIQCQAL